MAKNTKLSIAFYEKYLMTVDELEFYDEISCGDLFDGNDSRERIMIFLLRDWE